MNRMSATAALVLAAWAAAAGAAPVADAPGRAALMVKAPARAVLLAAARAGDRIVAVGERGIVALSDDGGAAWRQARVPVSVSLTAVRFSDARHGVATGHGGIVLTTADGGESWSRRLDGRAAARLALEAARGAGSAADIASAERLVADGADKPFFDVALFDAQRFVVVGAYGLAFATEDGGQRWQAWMPRLDNPKSLHLHAVRRAGDTLLIAGEQGLLLRSDDAGRSFRRLASPYKGSWFTAELPTPGEMIVAGLRGNAWRSTDAGARWAQLAAPTPATFVASALAADGKLLLANQAGAVLRAQDAQLVPVGTRPVPLPSGLVSAPGGRLLAVGAAGAVPVTEGKP
jgi:photosystem II stability/assembly factor-like uncharacterized protein